MLTYCHLPALLLVQSGWLCGKNTMRRQSVDHLGMEDIEYQINFHSSFHIICFTSHVGNSIHFPKSLYSRVHSFRHHWMKKCSKDFFFSKITLFLSTLFAFVVFPFKGILSVCLIYIVFWAFSFDLCKLLVFFILPKFSILFCLCCISPPNYPLRALSRWGSSDNL